LGSDHAGYELKRRLVGFVRKRGDEALDLGTGLSAPVEYPDYAEAVGWAILNDRAERGILVCGNGIGACGAANKLPGVRAGICHDTYTEYQGVEHDDMNILVMGSRVLGQALAEEITAAFPGAEFSGETRHMRRIEKVLRMERAFPERLALLKPRGE